MIFKFGRKYEIQEIYSWVEIGNMNPSINDDLIIHRNPYVPITSLHPEFIEFKTEFIKQMDKIFENAEWNFPIR